MRLDKQDKDMDDDKAHKRWSGHWDVILKVRRAKHEGARLPAYVLTRTGIRDLNLPKLKALLAFTIVVKQNHLYARTHKEQATISHLELDDFIINLKQPREPEPEAFFSEFNFDQRDVPVTVHAPDHAPDDAADAPVAANMGVS